MRWAPRFFGNLYAEAYRGNILDDERTSREVAFARSVLGLKDKRIIDIAAGFGRHARLLASDNHVYALDLSLPYLQLARRSLPTRVRGNPKLIQADFRYLPLRDATFDAALLLFNSFGYVDEDGVADRPVLDETARVLRPGGGLLIEIAERRAVVAAVRSAPRRHLVVADCELIERYWLTGDNRVLAAHTRFVSGGRQEEAEYSIRLYSSSELAKLLRSCGFSVQAMYGSYSGENFRSGVSEMLLIHANKR